MFVPDHEVVTWRRFLEEGIKIGIGSCPEILDLLGDRGCQTIKMILWPIIGRPKLIN